MAGLRWLVLGIAAASLGIGGAEDPTPGWKPHAPDDWNERLVPDGRRPYLQDVEGNACLRCHEAIGEEWRQSTHACAWQDEHYQEALKTARRAKSCHGCHIPAPLSLGKPGARPGPRSENPHLGVDCASCHLAADGETVLGATGVATDAHPTERSPLFETFGDGALCVSCHQTTIGPVVGVAKDFVATEQHERGRSCVDCHMPVVTRAPANLEDGTPLEARPGRSHRIATTRDPHFLQRAFALSARVAGGRAVLSIENRCGHEVPGLVGRRFTFRARLVDPTGAPVMPGAPGAAQELVIDTGSPLPADGTVELELDGSGATLELEAFHEAPGFAQPVRFLERGLALDGG